MIGRAVLGITPDRNTFTTLSRIALNGSMRHLAKYEKLVIFRIVYKAVGYATAQLD